MRHAPEYDTNPGILHAKLAKLEEIIRKLQGHRARGRAVFLDDTMLQDAVTLNLVIGVEEITDIGNHIRDNERNTVGSLP